jgi:hypothetical protein
MDEQFSGCGICSCFAACNFDATVAFVFGSGFKLVQADLKIGSINTFGCLEQSKCKPCASCRISELTILSIRCLSYIFDRNFLLIKLPALKKITLLLACFAFIFAALLLTSCSLEKRHYRKGYFVQQASGALKKHEQAAQPTIFLQHVALPDIAAATAHEDTSWTSNSVAAIEKNTADSSLIIRQTYLASGALKKLGGNILPAEQPKKIGSQPNLEDEPVEKKGEQKSGKGLIIAGIILMVLSLGVLVPILLLGLILFIVGVQKWIKIRREKGQLINTKPLWIAALIFVGLFLVSAVLAFTWEVLLVGVALSLPIALILIIVASRIDKRNRKVYQSQSGSPPPQERFRKLKKALKWVAISLSAILLAAIIGAIIDYG